MLIGGGCSRAYWEDEQKRRQKAEEQGWVLKESQVILLRPGPQWSMT